MMDLDETLQALRELKVETGSFACMGCGHENSCGMHGCAILRRAEELLREQGKILAEINGRQIEGNAVRLWDPCRGCGEGWETISKEDMRRRSCHDTCERLAAYLRARQERGGEAEAAIGK